MVWAQVRSCMLRAGSQRFSLLSFALGVSGLEHAGGWHEVLDVLTQNLVLWLQLQVLLFDGVHPGRQVWAHKHIRNIIQVQVEPWFSTVEKLIIEAENDFLSLLNVMKLLICHYCHKVTGVTNDRIQDTLKETNHVDKPLVNYDVVCV